mgnify:CR=1 FL=1
MISVLIVDDHPLFAEGLKSMFRPEDDIEVVAITQNGHEAPHLIKTLNPDVILMDIDMPIIDGISTMELLHAQKIDTPILMLTMHQSIRYVKNALNKGAQGYILKDASKPELVKAVTQTSKRESYFHPKVNEQVFDYLRGKSLPQQDAQKLSDREKEIIRCLSEGMNTKAISETLFISEHTVKTHRKNIMHKLQVKTSAELVRLAIEKGIIEVNL